MQCPLPFTHLATLVQMLLLPVNRWCSTTLGGHIMMYSNSLGVLAISTLATGGTGLLVIEAGTVEEEAG